jgi:hypothetical protein
MMRVHECYSETTTTTKMELGNVTWRPEKGHLVPEVRVANEIA